MSAPMLTLWGDFLDKLEQKARLCQDLANSSRHKANSALHAVTSPRTPGPSELARSFENRRGRGGFPGGRSRGAGNRPPRKCLRSTNQPGPDPLAVGRLNQLRRSLFLCLPMQSPVGPRSAIAESKRVGRAGSRAVVQGLQTYHVFLERSVRPPIYLARARLPRRTVSRAQT